MGRELLEFQLQGIQQDNATDLTTKEEVSISLQAQGVLQVLVESCFVYFLLSCALPLPSRLQASDNSLVAF